jgi:GNAT superfamily N-acetyltransferase
MLEFKAITPEDSSILDRRFLKAEQAGAADEPRDTIEVARKYERARPVTIHDGEELIAFLVYEALDSESRAFLIWDFVVHRDHQGKGHGFAIMKQLVDFL